MVTEPNEPEATPDPAEEVQRPERQQIRLPPIIKPESEPGDKA